MPRVEKKVFCAAIAWSLHATARPLDFFPACSGCRSEVVDGIICLEIFEKSVRTAFGEPLARSFAKKMVLAPKSYFFLFGIDFEAPFLSVFGRNLLILCFISSCTQSR